MPEISELRERVVRWKQLIVQTTDPKSIEVMTSIVSALEAEIRRQESGNDTSEGTGEHV